MESGTGDRMLGRTVGNYTITAKIGEGGMGAVYQAEHPTIGRQVAIKVLRAHLAGDPELVARFFREARAVNQVRHPNVVQVIDLGQTSDGILYTVMELLEGESLSARLRRGGPLPLGQAVTVFEACASALEAVHAKGIVHRDLKPDNIFLAREGDREVVKVLDFGVAKLLNGADTSVSQTGAIIGTPAYMSPEQCEGAREVDARTDVYAMGCVLFHMLTGTPPFVADSVTKLIVMHVTLPPPPACATRPDLPIALEQVIQHSLAKRPEERLQSMSAFRTALVAAAGGHADTQALVPGFALAATISAPSGITTLGGAAGQRTTAPTARRGRGKLLLALLGASAVAAGVLYVATRGGDAAKPAGPTAKAVARADAAVAPATGTPAAHALVRSHVDNDHCTAALTRAAQLMTGQTGSATRAYRHLARFATDPVIASGLLGSCRQGFDDAMTDCLTAATSADGVVRCADDFLARACQAGTQTECASLGWKAFESGDHVRAAELGRAACAAGVGQGCTVLGVLAYYGRGGPVDLPAAIADFARGMAVDDANAYSYGAYLAEHGIGRAADLAEARNWYLAACKLDPGHPACGLLAALEAAGQGGKTDRDGAAKHARLACDDEMPDGCLFLGAHERDPAKAQALLQRALALYAERSAVLPQYALHHGEMLVAGQGGPPDVATGAAEIASACAAHEPVACLALGQLHVSGKLEVDVSRSRAAYQQACTAGIAAACEAARCQQLLDPSQAAPAPGELARCKAAGHLGPITRKGPLRQPTRSDIRKPVLRPRNDDDLSPGF